MQCTPVQTVLDGNGMEHTLERFPVVMTGSKKKRRARVQSCFICGRQSTMFCVQCKKLFCYIMNNNFEMGMVANVSATTSHSADSTRQ